MWLSEWPHASVTAQVLIDVCGYRRHSYQGGGEEPGDLCTVLEFFFKFKFFFFFRVQQLRQDRSPHSSLSTQVPPGPSEASPRATAQPHLPPRALRLGPQAPRCSSQEPSMSYPKALAHAVSPGLMFLLYKQAQCTSHGSLLQCHPVRAAPWLPHQRAPCHPLHSLLHVFSGPHPV